MHSNRIQTLLCLAIGAIMLLPNTAQAAPAKKKADNKKYAKSNLDLYQLHHLNMWGGVGYSGLVNGYTNNSFIGGGGGLIGVGYEWHYKNFMLGLGPEFRLFTSADHYSFPNRWDIDISRTEIQAGIPMQVDETKHFNLHNFRENNTVGQVMLPIVAGAQFPDAQVPMFFLAGVKLGYTLFSNYSQRGDLTTSVTDRIAMDEWFDMPEHDVQTVPYAAKGAIKPGLDVAITAEAGVLLEKFFSEEWQAANAERKYPWHMRLSLFLDYGLPILHNGGSAPVASVTKDPADASKLIFATNSIHASDASTGPLNSLMVGVKFAAQLQLNHPKQKKPLNPYIGVRVEDARSGELITPDGLRLTVQPVGTKRAPRQLKAQTKGALYVTSRLAPGEYILDIAKAGYLPHEPVQVEAVPGRNLDVKKLQDTTLIRLNPVPVFQCYVLDNKTGKPVVATVQVVDTTNNKPVAKLRTNLAQGHAKANLPVGGIYSALVEAPNYHAQIFAVGVQELDDIERTFRIDPIEKGKTYVIENLFFASNETRILPQSEEALQKLYEFLSENPDVRIRIVGHTDWVGTDRDNQILSEGRAASVKQSMVERGIDPARIETEGKGESQPVDTNETEEGRQHNRRVEFTIL